MNKVASLFGYIHYRVYYFFKAQGDNVPEFKGTMILTLLQLFTIVDIMVIVKIFHDYPFPNKFTLLPLLILNGIFNWYKYERNFDIQKIESRWKDESIIRRKRNGWLIGLYIAISFLIPALYGFLAINLKVIS